MYLTTFRNAYVNRLEQEEKNKRIKMVCGVVASVAGFVFAPALKEVANAVVDFTNPLEIVSKLYGEGDIARFLAEQSDKDLPELIQSELDVYAISKDEFETLLRENIALLHPEIVTECEEHGLVVSADGGRSSVINSVVVPSLESEESAVAKLLEELHAALVEARTPPDRPEFILTADQPINRRPIQTAEEVTVLPVKETFASTDVASHCVAVECLTHQTEEREAHEANESSSTATSSKDHALSNQFASVSLPSLDLRLWTLYVDQANLSDQTEEHQLSGPRKSTVTNVDPNVGYASTAVIASHVSKAPYHAAVVQSRGDVSVFQTFVASIKPGEADPTAQCEVQLRKLRRTRDKLNAAAYAYALGYASVGNFVAAQMERPVSDFDTSPATAVVLLESMDTYPFVCAVHASEGDLSEYQELYDLMDEDVHALDAAIEADVERVDLETVSWLAVEHAAHLGYVNVVKWMLKEVHKEMLPTQKIQLHKHARTQARMATGGAA